ncbi:hypothetical protein [Streptomyces paromomycinus]|uniref:hypothetical protein n=1 Tax=Streptomyces paromomycinus TaxID=92743 RepID=UPI001FE3AD25|nr:hypothetical protein [Streptomyces paromomycinus]
MAAVVRPKGGGDGTPLAEVEIEFEVEIGVENEIEVMERSLAPPLSSGLLSCSGVND